ncbi:Unknown protein sequence [Pseudomonas syringae pv. cilantro]|uniref:Uncharacterized protein n=1 Tax=Pseudomonas syringae pv. cilantro TaxID=81035 RepID=A0A0N0X7L7_PSESX|nr:Unknown protein sequence [Pseudomonas syringae pv. cilantro]
MILSATKKPAFWRVFLCLRFWRSCQQYPGSKTPDAMRRAFQA